MPTTKTAKQVRYLESKSSPLTKAQKLKMNDELREKTIKIVNKKIKGKK